MGMPQSSRWYVITLIVAAVVALGLAFRFYSRDDEGEPRRAGRSAAQGAGDPSAMRETTARVEYHAGETLASESSQTLAGGEAKAEVLTRIERIGRTPPDWWDAVSLPYPDTLDLSWTRQIGGRWDPRRNVDHYLWSTINPNPSRWKEGAKLVHHLLQVNKGKPDVTRRAMAELGRIYTELLADFARGALWHRKAGTNRLGLARCYWKLGGPGMARGILEQIGSDTTRFGSVIKLWADMGELDTALRLAEEKAHSGSPSIAHLAAADGCRLAGKYEEALGYYQKVLAAHDPGSRPDDVEKAKERAQAGVEAIKVFEALDLGRVPDGTYAGRSISYAGPLSVEVVVRAGEILSVRVTELKDKQFYSALTDTPRQIVEKQGVKGVDSVTGATMTSEAIINATAKALAQAMK